MNICQELRCPHAYKNGCNRFTVSNLCPVGCDREIEANQYWLFAPDTANVDINRLRNCLKTEVLDTEASSRLLDAEARFRETKPVMIWSAVNA